MGNLMSTGIENQTRNTIPVLYYTGTMCKLMSTGIKNQTRDTILSTASIEITTLFNEFYFNSGTKLVKLYQLYQSVYI